MKILLSYTILLGLILTQSSNLYGISSYNIPGNHKHLVGLSAASMDFHEIPPYYEPLHQSQKPDAEVSGTVTDPEGETLVGVTIQVKGAGRGAVSDSKGEYRLDELNEDDVLVFSYIGFLTQEIPVNSRSIVDVVMQVDVAMLDAVVVVGYGTVKKELLTGAVSSVKSDELTRAPADKLSNVLAGRLSGVYVNQSTGIPGSSSNIRVRSMSSWNSSPPLYVIDGVVRDKASFDRLDVNEVDEQ